MNGPCPLCRAPETEESFAIPFYPPFAVRRCRACGVGFTSPPVENVTPFYPPAYYGRGGRKFNALIELLVFVSRLRRAQRIERFVPKGRILDVGCGGRTYFLSRMNARGWEAHGNELVEFPSVRELEREGVRFTMGDFLTTPYAPGSFDVVVLWHVLEHLPKPAAALAKARELLRPGGLLVLALPNYSSLQAGWTGASWFHLDVPRHYYHFPKASIERLLETAGFKIAYASNFSFEQDLFSWLQSLYNVLGFRHNLLYEFLRNRDARLNPLTAADGLRLAGAALLLPFLIPLSAGLFLLEVALGRGGSMELYATR